MQDDLQYMNKQCEVKKENLNIIQLIIIPQRVKYLEINVIKEDKKSYTAYYQSCWKKLKDTLQNENILFVDWKT